MQSSMWVDMTNLYQLRDKISDSEQSMPYILELTRVFTKTAGKVRLQQAFRNKSSEAKEVFLKNSEFLMSIDVYMEKQGRGLILVLNDKNPY
jgi:proteasome lid subunit RPN8/RPN11